MTPAELQAWAAERVAKLERSMAAEPLCYDVDHHGREAIKAALVSAYQEGHAAGVAEERDRADAPGCRCHLDDPYCPVHVEWAAQRKVKEKP